MIGAIVLRQVPSSSDLVGVLLVMLGVAIHKPAAPSRAI
jgi:inner membrane transporter RhtA